MMINRTKTIINYSLLIINLLFLSCTKPDPKNPFDPQVSPDSWAPSNLQYEVLDIHSIQLNWTDNSNGEEGFTIERKVNNGSWTQLAQVNENITQYFDDDVTIEANIQYRIYAFAGSSDSNIIETTNIEMTFPAPSNLTYTVLDINTIQLNWTDNSNGEEGFTIERKVNNGSWTQLAQVNENITQYTDNNVNLDDTFFYRVCAFIGTNNSAYSNETIYTSIDGMVYVQGGSFNMGDHYNEGNSDELPVHSVSLADFFISKTEVTHTQYIEFLNDFGVSSNGSYNGTQLIDMDDSDCAVSHNGTSFYFDGSSYVGSEDCPVIEVTWYGAVVFCNWRSQQEGLSECYNLSDWSCDFSAGGFRLPTEAEWEYAARGGVNWTDNYRYSGCHQESDLTNYAWYSSNSDGQTQPVGTKLPNQLGIYDMSGNVWEWCNDWYDSNYYSSSPQNNPTGPTSGNYRVLRGGSWNIIDVSCRVSSRNYNFPSGSLNYFGFRISRTSQ